MVAILSHDLSRGVYSDRESPVRAREIHGAKSIPLQQEPMWEPAQVLISANNAVRIIETFSKSLKASGHVDLLKSVLREQEAVLDELRIKEQSGQVATIVNAYDFGWPEGSM